ncbi:MAG: hypothetical protein ACFFER_12860 [Candidatus Thorarchaeota archaeon]
MKVFEGSLWEFFLEALKEYKWHVGYVISLGTMLAIMAAVVNWIIILVPIWFAIVGLVGVFRCLYSAYRKKNYTGKLIWVP